MQQVEVSLDALERAAAWLVATQRSDGGWSYRPLPGLNEQPSAVIPDHVAVTHSMTAAGVGMLYLCFDSFGWSFSGRHESDALPAALTPVEEDGQRSNRVLRPSIVSRQAFENAIRAGNGWFTRHFAFDVPYWTHYYMYGFDRYKSFQETVEGQRQPEPSWYNRGAEFLRRTQQAEGSWKSPLSPTSDATIDTAFAVLFLTRSSQKTIQKTELSEGQLVGGKGLPKDTTDVILKEGHVLSSQMVRDVEGLLSLVDKVQGWDPALMASTLALDEDPARRASQLARLRRLVSHKNYQIRLTATKTLSKSRDLDNVPALIYSPERSRPSRGPSSLGWIAVHQPPVRGAGHPSASRPATSARSPRPLEEMVPVYPA